MHLPADMAIVGRDREQAELATALMSTRAGYGRAVLLPGEAGMGLNTEAHAAEAWALPAAWCGGWASDAVSGRVCRGCRRG